MAMSDGDGFGLKTEIEVSVHHVIQERGVLDADYEVHTGFEEDEYAISEELAIRVYAETGLDLWNARPRSGVPIRIVEEDDDE